jgi:hypothetical protein
LVLSCGHKVCNDPHKDSKITHEGNLINGRTGIIAVIVINKQNYELVKEKGKSERETRKRSSNNPRVNKYIKV